MKPERKGGAHKKKRKSIKISSDTHEELVSLTQSSKHDMIFIIGFLVDLCKKYKFLEGGWEGRLNEALDQVDKDRSKTSAQMKLTDACPALAHTEKDGYVCCVNAPSQKKLGLGTYEDMKQVCDAHKRMKGIIDELSIFRERAKKGIKIEIPQCTNGGIIYDDGKFWCPKIGKKRDPSDCARDGCRNLTKAIWDMKGKLLNPEANK